ncbi:MAG: hypothetical protein J6A15_02065 [Clostridia bacterium]|nr:hypothetical protein [Clostridia bacterium]
MKNKVFGVWLRELCSLVFVQSIQALLFTIMLTLVVRLYIDKNDSAAAQQSMGVYAILVMTIIPKVELLVKRIFGLGSGVMDDSMMGGKNSLLKTGLAIRGAASLLNNGRKVAGGLVGLGSVAFGTTSKRTRIAENNAKAAGELSSGNPTSTSASSSSTQTRRISGSTSGGARGNLSLGDLTTAIKNANSEDPQEALQKAKHEARQKSLESLKAITSGVTETVGAIGGASLGAVVGLGMGGDDILTNAAIGAGIGDKAGKLAVDATIGNAAKFENWQYDYSTVSQKLKSSEAKLKKAEEEKEAQKAYEATVAKTQNVKGARGTVSSVGATRVTNSSPATATKKNVSKNLSAPAKQYYEKAKAAKAQGNMEEYKKNRELAAAVIKGEKTMKNPTRPVQTSASSNSSGPITTPSSRDKSVVKSIARHKKTNIQSDRKIHGPANNAPTINNNINSIDGM